MSGDGVQGAQSLQRAIAILRIVATTGLAGCRPADVAAQAALNLATADRMLRVLAEEGLLERHGPDRLYRIGPELVSLAAVRMGQASIAPYLGEVLTQLAAAIGDVVYLTVRVGDEAVCMARMEGDYPIRVLGMNVGKRVPLGVGAGALAMLAFLDDGDGDAVIAANRDAYAGYGLAEAEVRARIARTRQLGYALIDGEMAPEMTAVAVPLYNRAGELVAAISVAAITARLQARRQKELVALIREALVPVTPLPQ